MSRRSLRNLPSLNYLELHNRGNYVYKERHSSSHQHNSSEDSDSTSSTKSSPLLDQTFSSEQENTADLDKELVLQFKSFTIGENGDEVLPTADANLNADVSEEAARELAEKELAAVAEEEEELDVLVEEFSDFLDENKMDVVMNALDLDAYVLRMEEYRKLYKGLERKIRKKVSENCFKQRYARSIKDALECIKACIIEAKKKKAKLRESEINGELVEMSSKERERMLKRVQNKEAVEFLIQEVGRLIAELNFEFSKTEEVDDEELLRRKEDHPENSLQLDRLSSKIQQVYQSIPDDYNEREVKKMKEQYASLLEKKKVYDLNLEKQIAERELLKEKAFQTSALNIKLTKFKGYESFMDIYTFQSEFEKLYLRVTPKKMLPDLLKNNYLEDPALALVKSQDDFDEIWLRLKKSYGDKKVMLHRKLTEVSKLGSLEKPKDLEELKQGLTAIVNSMHDLMKLAEKHDIESKLYNGDGLNIIYNMLGDSRLTRWLNSISEEDLEDKALWTRLIKFLDKELKVTQTKALVRGTATSTKNPPLLSKKPQSHHVSDPSNNQLKCHFCDGLGHATTNGPKRMPLVQYFACEKFVKMPVHQRFQELRAKDLCHQCLFPGAKQNEGKHKDGTCQNTYTCKHPSHDKFPRKKHVLVCSDHCDTEENKALFDDYKTRFIMKQRKPLADFTKEMRLSFHVYSSNVKKNKIQAAGNDAAIVEHEAVYGLQVVEIDGERYTLFYDSGCMGLVSKYNAILRLKNRAVLEVDGPTDLGGVGDIKVTSPYGEYRINLPMYNGRNASMSGVSLEQITHEMPTVPLNTQVKDDVERGYVASGGNVKNLPGLPKEVGGEVDIMIGAKYLRYSPEAVFRLPSGLTIYESKFINADGGGRGVICGPHPIFTKILHNANTCFLTEQYKIYRMGYQVNPDLNRLSGVPSSFPWEDSVDEESIDVSSCTEHHYTALRQLKQFEEVENAGSTITYRCIECRGCKSCKNSEQTEVVSIREEIEQELINESVTLNHETQRVEATLPCMENPLTKLAPNRNIVYKLYQKRVKTINKSEQDKADTIAAEQKLQKLGYVDYVKNLPTELQKKLKESPIQNYIPWFPVWSSNSVTTTCRPVFDVSMVTSTGHSLNSILPKGKNNMNALVEIMIRWTMYRVGMHTDVKQLYNRIKLKEDYWCFQRYIWEQNLDPTKIPEEKVIKTVIYGVRSSGNQDERL